MRKELFSLSYILPALVIAFVYIAATLWLMNIKLVGYSLGANYPIITKIKILNDLLSGMFTSMPPISIFLLILSGILTGADIMLVIQKVKWLRQMGKLQLTIGGGLVLGVVGSGCSACGLPLVSLMGLGGSALALPFQGQEIAFLSVVLLLISFIMLERSIQKISCEIPSKVKAEKK